jgi:hypothetical protein
MFIEQSLVSDIYKSINDLGGVWIIFKYDDQYAYKLSWSNNQAKSADVRYGRIDQNPITKCDLENLITTVKYRTSSGASYKIFKNESSMNDAWNKIIEQQNRSSSKEDDVRTVKAIGVGILFAGAAHVIMSRNGNESNKIIVAASGLAGVWAYRNQEAIAYLTGH